MTHAIGEVEGRSSKFEVRSNSEVPSAYFELTSNFNLRPSNFLSESDVGQRVVREAADLKVVAERIVRSVPWARPT